MVARIRGFPDSWTFCGRKTAAYWQIGNAFPPPVATALGKSIHDVLGAALATSARPIDDGHEKLMSLDSR
jgi:DNA (cytosine-5)-methyltransferase 1